MLIFQGYAIVGNIWPGVADCCGSLRRSFGAVFFFEERLNFATAFAATAVFVTSEQLESASSPFFCNLAASLSGLVGSLVPEIGSVDTPHVFAFSLINSDKLFGADGENCV